MASLMNSWAFFILLISLLFTPSYANRGPLVGGKTDIPDVKSNSEVQQLGRFSVEEYNRSLRLWWNPPDEPLEFRRVVEAQRQVVSGIKYYLKISASQNRRERMFDSEVVVKPWLHSKQLLHFARSRSSTNLN
ncbi:cysteine proteinase inhibitor B-like [Prosopis cineraria]|uniref:cysteine proteinase inhibitor B-like n=1 Tax=Prosopis cineraria TaxID=364024 RepID=UPI00240F5B6F|nr:cysteine proteinase inhibitor B-like [Prosopis cineraria]